MTKTLITLSAVLLIGTAVALAARNSGTSDDEQDDAKVASLNNLPAPARDALKKLAGSAKLGEVTMEDEDGLKVYEATWQANGVAREATVTEHGEIVETEEVVSSNLTPKAVQDTATKSFPKGSKLKLEKKTIVLYEIESQVDGREREILVAPTGQRVEIEHEEQDERDDDGAR